MRLQNTEPGSLLRDAAHEGQWQCFITGTFLYAAENERRLGSCGLCWLKKKKKKKACKVEIIEVMETGSTYT